MLDESYNEKVKELRTIILGAGSIGLVIGALISKNGGDVTLVTSNRIQADELNRMGARLTGKVDLSVPVKAIASEEMSGIYDLVLYTVKTTANESALPNLLPYLHERSIVCTFQNGVPEESVAEYVGWARVIGCVVAWNAVRTGPTVSNLASDLSNMSFDVGEIDGSVTERVERVAEVLRMVCPTNVSTNLVGVRWTKLSINAGPGAVCAALGCNFGEYLDNDKALGCGSHIVNETIHVADASGIKLEPLQGIDPRIFGFRTRDELLKRYLTWRKILSPHRPGKSSMLLDLEKGRKTEIDVLNEVVSRRGRDAGVPTPVNNKVIEIIKDIEAGMRRPVFQNLDDIVLPILP